MPILKREFVRKNEVDPASFLSNITKEGWVISAPETYPSGVIELTYVAYKEVYVFFPEACQLLSSSQRASSIWIRFASSIEIPV